MYTLKFTQEIPTSLQEGWDFFSSPQNLKILTPEHLRFEILTGDEMKKMYPGQIIAYKIYPILNIPIEWVTEITHVEKPYFFIDEQRFGPYKFWHHEHRFREVPNGVEIQDLVYYKMPFGLFGKAFHALKVKKDLDHIFAYRKAKLEQIFG